MNVCINRSYLVDSTMLRTHAAGSVMHPNERVTLDRTMHESYVLHRHMWRFIEVYSIRGGVRATFSDGAANFYGHATRFCTELTHHASGDPQRDEHAGP